MARKRKSHSNVAVVLGQIFTLLIDKDAGEWVRLWIKENPPSFVDDEGEDL